MMAPPQGHFSRVRHARSGSEGRARTALVGATWASHARGILIARSAPCLHEWSCTSRAGWAR